MTESWFIVVDHTICQYHLRGTCNAYNDGIPRMCCRENCIMCIIEKNDLLINGREG